MASDGNHPWKKYRAPDLGFADVHAMIGVFEFKEDVMVPYQSHGIKEANKRSASFLLCLMKKCIPSFNLGNFCLFILVLALLAPEIITYFIIYPFCRLVFGTLYPAYASYKAVRTKNLKEYVKWMMYWIVFALFTCAETFTDVFLSWFPFYYEVKIVLVLWLLSPATRGSSILYRKFVHPALCRREQEIDEYIAKAKEQGYHTVLNLGTKGVNYATTVIMQTAIKGGGGLVQQLRKSYSLSDLSEDSQHNRAIMDEVDDVLTDARVVRRVNGGRRSYNRSASESNSRSAIYFSEVDVDILHNRGSSEVQDFSHIKSSEDISSGYSSADNSIALRDGSLTRAGSIGARTRQGARQAAAAGNRTALTNIRRPVPAEAYDLTEEFEDSPHLITTKPIYRIPNTNPSVLLECVGDNVNIIQLNNDDQLKNIACIGENISYETSNIITPLSLNKIGENKNDYLKNEFVQLRDLVMETTSIDISEVDINKCKNNDAKYLSTNSSYNDNVVIVDKVCNEDIDCIPEISLDDKSSLLDDINRDSDDEASFGTPEESPKSKKKIVKGRYGKSKAPSPPKMELNNSKLDVYSEVFYNATSSDVESLNNNEGILNLKTKYNTVDRGVTKRKKRNKSHSPSGKSESTMSKFMHLSGKLAFWNKNQGDRNSGDFSTSSSEQIASYEDKQTINESAIIPKILISDFPKTTISNEEFDDATNDIINKSNALQKLIDAKIESNPEYKRVSLHEDEISNCSKSTDV